jgi:hypothetical protein
MNRLLLVLGMREHQMYASLRGGDVDPDGLVHTTLMDVTLVVGDFTELSLE